MKVPFDLVVLMLFLAGGNGAPAVPEDIEEGAVIAASGTTKDNVPETQNLSPEAPVPNTVDDRLNSQSGSDEPQEETLDDMDGEDTEASESSVSFPPWMKEEIIDSVIADVNSAEGINSGNILLSEIESALVKENLEPLYISISQLKSLLLQLRDKADLDIRNIGESIPGEDQYSVYSSVGDSYLSSDGKDDVGIYPDGNDRDTGEFLERVLEEETDENHKAMTINSTESDPRSKAVESAMTDFHKQKVDTKQTGRRFKRDLGWGRGSRFQARYNTPDRDEANFVSSVYEENADGEAWGSSSLDMKDPLDGDTEHPKMTWFRQRMQWTPREEIEIKKLFSDLGTILNANSNRFERRRRYKEDIQTFVETMPTLEGMRKRTSPADESENEPIIPDPGPFIPVPPNLPPPGNAIHPFLPPAEMLQWQPSPDFEEDNALLEEQTNGVETNPFHKRLRYLEDVERSIMMEPLEDLAMELAGQNPLYPNEALRVRRMMQIPPPPPYGRKVVKSLYRKKAFGYPFVDSFDTPFDGYDLSVSRRGIRDDWADYLPFGRVEDPDRSSGVDTQLIESLLSAIAKKEIKDTILRNLLSLQDMPPEFRREALLQALVEEIASSTSEEETGEDSVDSEIQESESAANSHWGSFGSNDDNGDDGGDTEEPDDFLMNDVVPKFDEEKVEENIAGGGWGSSIAEEESESEPSVPDWGGVMDALYSNIPEDLEEAQHKMLFHKLTEVLQQASDMKH